MPPRPLSGFTGSLPNDVTIVGETGYIRTSRPCQCPEAYTLVTRQGDEPDPMGDSSGKIGALSTPQQPAIV